ncbi:hypothetical protein ACJX0J_037180, partial [Zea mays]
KPILTMFLQIQDMVLNILNTIYWEYIFYIYIILVFHKLNSFLKTSIGFDAYPMQSTTPLLPHLSTSFLLDLVYKANVWHWRKQLN